MRGALQVGRMLVVAALAILPLDAWSVPDSVTDVSGDVFTAPQTGGLIMCRVIDGVTGHAIAGADVRLGSSRPQPSRLTDAEGRAVFFDLPAGTYRITAAKAGYAHGEFGQRWVGANAPVIWPRMTDPRVQRTVLADGERRGHLVIHLWPFGSIAGRVLDEAGEPVVGMLVQAWPGVLSAGRPWFNHVLPSIGCTDDRGIYRIPEVNAGDYVVVAPALSVSVPSGWKVPGAREPWHGEFERIAHMFQPSWYRTGLPVAGSANAVDASDGIQWLAGQAVAPRRKAVSVAYPTTFHPGTESGAGAATVSVSPGAEIGSIDFRLRLVSVVAVSGLVTGPSGPAAGVTLSLKTTSAGETFGDIDYGIAVSDARGAFTFVAVPPGSYRIEALEIAMDNRGSHFTPRDASDSVALIRFRASTRPTAATLWGAEAVTVRDEPVSGVTVTLREGRRVRGTITFIGSSPPPTGQELEEILALDRADGRLLASQAANELSVSAGGAFASIGLAPGRYFVRAPRAPFPWTLQSALHGGRDLSLTAAELGEESIDSMVVTFTDTAAQLGGTVKQSRGTVDPDATVVLIPTDRSEWRDHGAYPRRMLTARVQPDGRYLLRGMPSGAYFVAALDDMVMRDWPSQQLLSAVAAIADRLQILDSQARVLDLTTREVRRP